MSLRAWVAFVTMAVVWGVPYLFIRIAVGEVSPPVVSWTRLFVAAAVLLPLAASRRTLRPALAHWPWILAMGAFYMALAWTLIPAAEQVLPSSLTAIVIAGVPMVITLMDLPRERPSPARLAGLGLGFAGVAALVGLDIGVGREQLLALGALAVVLVCYAGGPIVTSRKLKGVDAIAASALSAVCATVILTPFAALRMPSRVPSTDVLVALAVLGFLCSALALATWFFLIVEAGPARASIITYLNPAVAVLAGVLVLHERVGPGAMLGLVLILAGSWLGTRGRAPSRAPAEQPA